MSDKNKNPAPSDETAPLAGQRPAAGSTPDPAPPPADPPPAAAYDPADGDPHPASRRSWRERLRRGTASGGSRSFGVGALVAGTLAGLVLGGLGGAAIGAAVADDDRGDRLGHMDRGGHGDPRGDSFGRLPGQAPPGTVPERTTPLEDDDGTDDSSAS